MGRWGRGIITCGSCTNSYYQYLTRQFVVSCLQQSGQGGGRRGEVGKGDNYLLQLHQWLLSLSDKAVCCQLSSTVGRGRGGEVGEGDNYLLQLHQRLLSLSDKAVCCQLSSTVGRGRGGRWGRGIITCCSCTNGYYHYLTR